LRHFNVSEEDLAGLIGKSHNPDRRPGDPPILVADSTKIKRFGVYYQNRLVLGT